MSDKVLVPGGVTPDSFQPTSLTRIRARRLALSYTGVFGFLVLAGIVTGILFLVFAKSVRFEIAPNDAVAKISMEGPVAIKSGPAYLVLPGEYQVAANAPGFQVFSTTVQVGDPRNQTFQLDMSPLPGLVTVNSSPQGASISTAELGSLGTTPAEILLPEGSHILQLDRDRYQVRDMRIEVIGRNQQQEFSASLTPNWANVTLPTRPESARVLIDDVDSGFLTPGPIEVLAGEHKLTVQAPGFRDWSDILAVVPLEDITLPAVTLKRASGQVSVSSNPKGASVLQDGDFMGITPVTLDLFGKPSYTVELILNGYSSVTRTLDGTRQAPRSLHVDLEQVNGTLRVRTDPADAQITVDDEPRGTGEMALTLQAGTHAVEISRDGYASFARDVQIQPNLELDLPVRLLTNDEARLEALKQVRTTATGLEIVLMEPSRIRMGASRNQPGRRANEVFRTADLSRLFYLSRHEVTNAQFRELAPDHDSGEFANQTLDKPEQPVVNVSWLDAAKYCNYLSGLEGIELFYRIRDDQLLGVNTHAIGYRLPTEAEWTWASRHVEDSELLVYAWGEGLPPPSRFENFADATAQHVIGRTLFGYNDNYMVAAPVGKFPPNQKGIQDLGGNVSEWVHDYYSIPERNATVSPLGPSTGEYHVIRGASWMHGTITELRLSFRDYGLEGRRDVGFRIARFAE